MTSHLHLCGVLLTGLALLHAVFPRYFAWKTELAPLSLINRQLMVAHTFFIALGVLFLGVLCLTSAEDLTATPLGRRLCLFIGVFWAIRLVYQVFGYSRETWRGKRFETAMHILFLGIWSYLTAVFIAVWAGAEGS